MAIFIFVNVFYGSLSAKQSASYLRECNSSYLIFSQFDFKVVINVFWLINETFPNSFLD